MRVGLVPLLMVALVVSTSSAQTPARVSAQPAATLRAPVAVRTTARAGTPEEDRKERYRKMKERVAANPDRVASRREFDDDFPTDDRPIRRVSKEDLWNYIEDVDSRSTPRSRSSRLDDELDRDPLLPDRRKVSTRRDRPIREVDFEDDYDYEYDRRRSSGRADEGMLDWMDFEKPRGWLQSDRCFEGMISPVTNPFYFEDPRSVTEIRPIFIYQKIPTPQQDFKGGNLWFLGTQIRLAFTERISLTINKLGATAVNPDAGSFFGDNVGFSEFWLGPKFTIIRDEEAGTLLAGGAQFQLPIGQGNVFQDTGRLSIVPYVTLAHPYLKTQAGTFNGILNTGYSISTNQARSDFYYLNAHTSFDFRNRHKFFPLAELTWTHYTSNGTTSPLAGEGRDLFNFGSMARGSSLLTGALGGRYRFTKNAEIGAAFELPLAGNKDFFGHRFTIDFIWRY